MTASWLIRTSENKIFGPVSSAKILDLISRGSLKKGDEISAGNGYWLFVKESDLIKKFLKENITQPFNPINEASYVDISSYEMDFTDQGPVAKFPEAEDLEYPTVATAPGSMMANVEEAAADESEISFGEKLSLPSQDDLEYPAQSHKAQDEDSIKKISFDINELKPASEVSETSSNFPKGEDSEYPE